MVVNNLPILLTNYKGVKLDDKVAPVEKIPRLFNDNNKREFYESKKRNVQTPAVILRISKKGPGPTTTC
jgi:hypothetical protein